MRASARARHMHTHREVHGALFVQTINDVAQGHCAQFARISIVIIIIIIIIIERLFRMKKKRERRQKRCSSCTRSYYVFALLRKRTHTDSCMSAKHRNSNDVASFLCSSRPSSSSTCVEYEDIYGGEEVVVVVVIVMVVV